MSSLLRQSLDFFAPKGSLFRIFLVRFYYSCRKGTIKSLLHFLFKGHLIRSIKLQLFFTNNGPKYLQLGGGKHMKKGIHWLNGDIIEGDIYLDASKRLPFQDSSIDFIFTEQFFEHLSQKDGLFFLSEAYRVLKKDGVLRQSTPDLDAIIALYQRKNDHVSLDVALNRHIFYHRRSDDYIFRNGCQLFNDLFRLWGHKFIYDSQSYTLALTQVGFTHYLQVEFGKPGICSLPTNLERHADSDWMKKAFVMIYEAKK